MSGPVEIILIIAVVGYMLIRRLLGEPAEGKRMLLLPAVLTVLGVVSLAKVTQSPTSIIFLVVMIAVSLALGLLRGASIRVFEKDDIVYMRYTATTVVLLVLNVAIKIGGSLILGLIDPAAEQAAGSGLMLTLGASLLVEGLAVLSKAVRMGSRILWEKGKDGEPHKTSALLDSLQQKVQSTDWSQPRRRNRGGLSSLLEDVRNLDFRQPNNEASRSSDGPRPHDAGTGTTPSRPTERAHVIDPDSRNDDQ